MNNLNSSLIEGNMTMDAETRIIPKGTQVTTFQIASNPYYKQDTGFEKEVSFFTVESWGKLAEHADNHGCKGQGVRVVGRLKQERRQDANSKAQAKVSIVAEHKESDYDFAVIDTSPAYDNIIGNVLTASDILLIPVQQDLFSYQALQYQFEKPLTENQDSYHSQITYLFLENEKFKPFINLCRLSRSNAFRKYVNKRNVEKCPTRDGYA